MVKAIFASLAILAVANSAALDPRANQPAPGSGTQQFLINYNFETYPPTIRGSTGTSTQVVNDYDLLHFNTVLVNQTQPSIGVPCHTPPVCTAFTLNSGLLTGALGGGQDPISLGPAYVTSAYQYSPISYFDPYAFYYGCVVADLNGAASVPASCNITATGQTSSGKTVYSQVFQFQATTGAVTQPMDLGFFNQGWAGLRIQTLYFTVSNNATTAALFDNLVATVFGTPKAAITVDF